MKIKLIDDDREIAENMKAILEAKGYQIEIYNSFEGAVDFIRTGTADLAILDVMFPDNPAGGFDIARGIRKYPELEKLPVILLTGINQELPMDFSARDIDDEWIPVQAFLEKPVDPDVLLEKISELFNKGLG